MKISIIFTFLIVCFCNFALANGYLEILMPPTQQETIAQKNWNKFLDIVEKTGKVLESQYGDYLSVDSIDPEDKTKSHYANYFSLVGGRNLEGKFQYNRIEVVSENWQLKEDGNWHVDQYLYRLSPDQTLLMSMHVNMVQTKDRVVLKHEMVPMDDAQAVINWNRIRGEWYSRIGLD